MGPFQTWALSVSHVRHTLEPALGGGAMDDMFFRKGVVGDWSAWLTPDLARRIDDISDRQFAGSGIRLR